MKGIHIFPQKTIEKRRSLQQNRAATHLISVMFLCKETLPPWLRCGQIAALDEMPQVAAQQCCINRRAGNTAAVEQSVGIGSRELCLMYAEALNHAFTGCSLIGEQAGEDTQYIFITGRFSQAAAPFLVGQQLYGVACLFYKGDHLPQRHQPVIEQVKGMSTALVLERDAHQCFSDIIYRSQVQIYLHIGRCAQLYTTNHGTADKIFQLPNTGGKGSCDVAR